MKNKIVKIILYFILLGNLYCIFLSLLTVFTLSRDVDKRKEWRGNIYRTHLNKSNSNLTFKIAGYENKFELMIPKHRIDDVKSFLKENDFIIITAFETLMNKNYVDSFNHGQFNLALDELNPLLNEEKVAKIFISIVMVVGMMIFYSFFKIKKII